MPKTLSTLLVLFLAPFVRPAGAQTFDLPSVSVGDPASLAEAMPKLAEQVLAGYSEPDRDRYLNNLFRLQMVAGRWAEAIATIGALRELRRPADPGQEKALYIQYQVYCVARLRQGTGPLPFDEAIRHAFREVYGGLDDKTSHRAMFSFGASLEGFQKDLRQSLDTQQGKERIELAAALDLVRRYQVAEVYTGLLPLAPALIAEDDARRYTVSDDILVPTPDGARIAVLVVRPRAGAPLPALLNFTIYADPEGSYNNSRKTAAYGYAGVVAYTRGKGRSPDAAVPYDHDGADAAAVIDWISRQPWCDGRVGMYGGSYEGFTQWSAAKRRPPALKAIMPSVAVAPGIDLPMEGGVFQTFPYSWMPYVTNTKLLDDATYNDRERWEGLNRKWYAQGLPYRDLEKVDGHPNPIFRRWLDHPGYDAFWQSYIPYREELAALDIPVLSTTGYYDGCLVSTLYYFTEHYRYNPRARHYLLVGPWDHFGAQHRPQPVVDGYAIDPVARIDVEELRYQWFDFVFKGGERPALLADRVNYQVMGSNAWKHAPSLDAVRRGALRFHLAAGASPGTYRLSPEAPAPGSFLTQTVDLRDRSDADRKESGAVLDKTLDASNGLVFASDPLPEATEVSGLFTGRLDFEVNKRDLDLRIDLYEQSPGGEYLALSTYLGRASYAKDRSRRQLLAPNRRQTWNLASGRMTSRLVPAGSRLILVLRVNKRPDAQINYGTGKDVSDESIRDASEPVRLRWYGTSWIELPLGR